MATLTLEEKHQLTLSLRQKEILTGLMLGDGCLQFSHRGNRFPRLTQVRQATDKDYADWLYQELLQIYSIPPTLRGVYDHRTNKTYYSVRSQSLSLPCLTDDRIRWYPDEKKKIPLDLELTPLIILVWFLDDDSFIYRNPKSFRLKFATHGFCHDDVKHLSNLLSKRYQSNFRIVKDENNYYIETGSNGAIACMKEILPIFPQGIMERKKTWEKYELDIENVRPRDGKLISDIKSRYAICNFLISNSLDEINALSYKNLTKDYKNSKSLRYHLYKMVDENYFTYKRIHISGFNGPLVNFTLTQFGKDNIHNCMNTMKSKLDYYGISL